MLPIQDCKCINRDDKHELSKAILTRIEIYRNAITESETEEIIEAAKVLKRGEIEIKPSTTTKQYKEIIDRLENLHNRLGNTPDC